MSAPKSLGQLDAAQWHRFQELADRFHAAWQRGEPGGLDAFLPPADDPLRPLVLQELVIIDLEMRWRRGQARGLEEYLEKYPELGPAPATPVGLIVNEYQVRQRVGDRPPLDGYRRRFPDQFEDMRQLVQGEAPRGERPAGPQDAPGSPEENARSIGDYRLLERIGSAAFGEVWRGEAPGGVPVAVKVLYRPVDAEEAQRERMALELIRGLRHRCLIGLHRFWTEQERLYIVMDLADRSLRDRLDECREAGLQGIPAEELLGYFRDAAEGLDYLHSERVQHRDVKPENILLLHNHAKLADFGLARSQGSRLLSTATGAGTPLYMAPEVFNGKLSPHSDQFSLAMTYAELRLDRRLLKGTSIMEIMFEQLERSPDLSPLPEAEQRVILKALSKDPEKRYPDCRSLVRALQKVVTGAGRPAAPAAPPANGEGASAPPAKEAAGGASQGQPAGEREPAARPAVGSQTPGPATTTTRLKAPARRPVPRASPTQVLPRHTPPARRWRPVAGLVLLVLALGGLGAGALAYGWPRIFPNRGRPDAAALARRSPPAQGAPDTPPATAKEAPREATAKEPAPPAPQPDHPSQPPNPKPAASAKAETAAARKPTPYEQNTSAAGEKAPPPEPRTPPAVQKPPPPEPKPAEPASLVLGDLPPLVLGTGETKRVPVRVQRRNLKEPVALTFSGLPGGVTVADVPPLSQEGDSAEVLLTAAAGAERGSASVTVHAAGGGLKAETSLALTVVFLPDGFRPAPDARLVTDLDGRGKPYYDRIRRELPGGPAVEFALIPRARQGDPETFYLMVDKVSVGLFRKFIERTKAQVHADWNDRAEDGTRVDDAYPVFNVRVDDAYRCAKWLRGNLPAPAQWDKAAGRYDRDGREGPFRGKWESDEKPRVAVGLKAPKKVGEEPDDESRFGCRDMAGNGWEWTDSAGPGDRHVPLAEPTADDSVRLRGHSFQADAPLRFRDMDEPGQPVFPGCPYNQPLPDLGFRVAITLP